MSQEDIISFLVALFIGALVGTERTLDKRRSGSRFLGLRSFILIAELGALGAWLAKELASPWIFLTALIAVGSLLSLSYWQQNRKLDEFPGMITEFAALVVFLLSGTAVMGYHQLAVALGIVTTGLIALKETLNKITSRLRSREFLAALQLLFATFLILPTFPNKYIDPWEAINPRKLWLLVILICTLSMLGYLATRVFGQRRGATFTGIFGGLVSSTAVTLNFSRRSQKEADVSDSLAAGIYAAWLTMFIRMAVVASLINSTILTAIWLPLLMASLGPLGMMIYLEIKLRKRGKKIKDANSTLLQNPFELWSAIQFAALFAAVLLLSKWAQHVFNSEGIYLVTSLAAITDVDAITLSMAELELKGTISQHLAGHALLLAGLVNTVSKFGLVLLFGNSKLRKYSAIVVVACLVLGILGWLS